MSDVTADFYEKVLDALTDGVYFVDREGRITFWNRAAEAITGFSRSEILGRRCSDNILCHVNEDGCQLCLEGCPMTRTMESGREIRAEVYFRHAAGHRVPTVVRASPMRDDMGRIVGAVEVFTDNTTNRSAVERLRDLEEMAYLDPLTGLGNRRMAEKTLESRLQEMARYGWRVGVLFADVDHFKRLNDWYGHPVGDDVLKLIGRDLEGSLRVFDFAGRWGGEEFLGVLVHVEEDQLQAIGERFRMLVETSSLTVDRERVKATVSVGTTLARPDESAAETVARADALMYEAKRQGRNRVVCG